MELVGFYFFCCVLCLFGCFWFGLKILDWIRLNRASKFESNRSAFLSDLYRLAKKWAEAGELEYAETLNELIRVNSVDLRKKPGSPGLPLTNDSLSTDIQLKNLRKDEFKEFYEEFIG